MSAAQAERDFDFEQARFNLVEQQIRPWNVIDERVLAVLGGVPREDFVPPRYRNSLAFADLNLPLGHGEVMMTPKQEARLLQSLQVRPEDEILEVGTGSGYVTACLARLGGRVHSVDIHEDFLEAADRKLLAHGITNVTLEQRDAASGWPESDRFDVIAVTGSLPELHRGFHRALRPGGRLFLIVGSPPLMEARLITRESEDQWFDEPLFETAIPPLVNAPHHVHFTL
ncbi:MAG: protein-L-isoaspartate O-methyltransferase [Gammaproteobacteria bacterium]|nr:MAG: protein-L-isoaspartate O-methyltransferase [Gammaproteobacteria bacterium]